MPEPIRLPRLLTEREAAAALGVSIDTLRRERGDGRVRHTRIRGRVRYTEAHLAEYIEAGERAACAKGPTASAATSSPAAQTAPCGAGPGLTLGLDRHAAHRSAQLILTRRE
jgi:excisionase family DNA binding protein